MTKSELPAEHLRGPRNSDQQYIRLRHNDSFHVWDYIGNIASDRCRRLGALTAQAACTCSSRVT